MAQTEEKSELQTALKALSYLRTHWYLFLLEALLVAAYSSYKYTRITPIYQSSAALLIDSTRHQLYQSVLMPGAGPNQNARKQNVAMLLSSEDVMERFRTHLTEYYNTEGRPVGLRSLFPSGTAVPAESLKGMVSLNWEKTSDIYNIRCTATTADAAYSLCRSYRATIQAYYPEIGLRDTTLKRDFLARQVQSTVRQIQEREKEFFEFQKANPDFISYIVSNPEGKVLAALQAESITLRQKLEMNRSIKRIMITAPAANRGELTSRLKSIEALTSQIAELRYQRDLVMEGEVSNSRSRKLQDVEANLAQATRQLAELNKEEVRDYLKNPLPPVEVQKRLADLELEYLTGSTQLKTMEKQIAELSRRNLLFKPQQLEYERVQTELQQRRTMLGNLYVKEQETEIELSTGSAEIFTLREAVRNPVPISPVLKSAITSGAAIALGLIAVSIALLMFMSPRLDSEAEVFRMNLPVLGKIPRLPRQARSLDDIPSGGFEFLKIMNYRILRETKEIKCPVIVISSSYAMEGKSTTAQLIALASQAPNRKTLFIDGDLLTSNPTSFFGLKDDQTLGLRAILSKDPSASVPSRLVAKTVHEGIYLLPRGGREEPSSAPNYLDPARKAIEQFRKEYDMIFIDTPPAFSANLPHQWFGLADLIVIVARIYVTNPKHLLETIQTCKVFSKAPIGIALNCVPMSGAVKRATNYYFSKRKHKTKRLAA